MTFRGSYVALVTPFNSDGTIDEAKVRELVNYQIDNGTTGIAPCGTTGESPTLNYAEHKKMIKIVVEEVDGRAKVLAGAGANSTQEAVELSIFAEKAGADSILSVAPYYNKPTQNGLYEHYKKIAESVSIPIMLYNVPGRSGVNIDPETIYELSKIDNIRGVKEASGNIDQVCSTINLCKDNIDVFSGDDALLLPMMSIGAKGVVSVSANIMAKEVSDLVKYMEQGNLKEAREIHYKMWNLNNAMFLETNPIPIKTSMGLMGKIDPLLRLPLCEMEEKNIKILKNVLKDIALLP